MVKIRLQLQGEMQKIDTSMKLYRGVFHGLYQIGRYDGIRALQKGLGPAIPFQFILNSVRYEQMNVFHAFCFSLAIILTYFFIKQESIFPLFKFGHF